jgi:hypothetical protein
MMMLDILPPLHCVSPWTASTYDDLYVVFSNAIKGGKLIYMGSVVWHFPEMEDGKEKIFWHLTSRDNKIAKDRLPDLRRSERLPWVKPILAECPHAEVLHWDFQEGDKDIRSYVWLKDRDFIIVMKKYPDGRRRLITSFWIDQEHKRRKLEGKYKNRIA